MQKLYSQPIKREEKKESTGHNAPLNKPLFLPLVKPINGPMRSPGKKKEEETGKKTELAPDAYQSGLKAEDKIFQSQLFDNDEILELVAKSARTIEVGESGLHVRKIQIALLEAFRNELDSSALDSENYYGEFTAASVSMFKRKFDITEDRTNQIGEKTVKKLDEFAINYVDQNADSNSSAVYSATTYASSGINYQHIPVSENFKKRGYKDLNTREAGVCDLFKGMFEHQLPKDMIEHYTFGKGSTITLTLEQMKEIHPAMAGVLFGADPFLTLKESADFSKKLETIEKGKSTFVNFTRSGIAANQGTLGGYTIYFFGTLKKTTGTEWEFDGAMYFYDVYDFKTEEGTKRTDWGNIQTRIAEKYLPGQGYKIFSPVVKVKQTSATKYADWFYKVPHSEIYNKVSGFGKENPKTFSKIKEFLKKIADENKK